MNDGNAGDDEFADENGNAADWVGQCMSMCPPIDYDERAETNTWDEFELIDWRDRQKGSSPSLAVKMFRGSGAGAVGLKSAENVRPPAILQQTTNHILDYCFSHQRAHFVPGAPPEQLDGLLRLWNFLHNRFRAIRRDFTYQSNAARGSISVSVHEQQVRFFIYTAYQLAMCTPKQGYEIKYNNEVCLKLVIVIFVCAC
jgi:hypothetical protein